MTCLTALFPWASQTGLCPAARAWHASATQTGWMPLTTREAQAYEERTRAAAPKPIERRKVEAKLKEFVRETVRAAHLKRGGTL